MYCLARLASGLSFYPIKAQKPSPVTRKNGLIRSLGYLDGGREPQPTVVGPFPMRRHTPGG
jgi:hypothetical protein